MAKLFGLFLFMNFFMVGIRLGIGQDPVSPQIIFRKLRYFLVVYSLMALYLAYTTDFLVPH